MSALDADIDSRLAELRADPESFLHRFDTNQDGRIDGLELQAARAVVSHEILSGAGSTNETRVVNDRFEFLSELGHGAQGVTHLARDRQTNELVAVKTLNLKTAKQWKAVDLFHREVEALRRLSHPQIPAFVDAFDIDETEFFLVQTFVPGDNLRTRLARQELFNEARLKDIAEQLLEVLTYLHGQSPPVLHRDVKPANIIIGDDGKVTLVDFGAAQNQGSRGTTIVGTSGYMPPEQLTGRAVPASDVYAAGALLVHAASRVHPSDLEVSQLKLQWRSRARVGDALADWIDRLIAPVVEDRPRNADEALRWLKVVASSTDAAKNTAPIARRPSSALVQNRTAPGGSISITQNHDGFVMTIQPPSWTSFLLKFGLVSIPVLVIAFLAISNVYSLFVLGVGLIVALFYIWHFVQGHALRKLAFSPEKVDVFRDGVLEASININDLDGPAVFYRSHVKGFYLLKKDGQARRLTRRTPGKDEKWGAHEIRKYLSELK